MSAKLISIIGPPASGKSTVAELLAAGLPGELLCEDYAGNPFLAAAYTGATDYRLPSQLYFMLSRVKQMSLTTWPESGIVVADYGYCQDRIFAELLMEAADLNLYDEVARRVAPLVKPPDATIHLYAPVEELQRRIAGRGREFEQVFADEFLLSLMQCNQAALGGLDCPVWSIDTFETDLRRPDALVALISEIRQTV